MRATEAAPQPCTRWVRLRRAPAAWSSLRSDSTTCTTGCTTNWLTAILRDKADLEFKRDSQAKVSIKQGELVIEKFYPMNLLQKLSLQKESVEDWKELAESVLIDWNYDGAVLQPAVVDIPGKNEMVKGAYKVPDDAGTIRVKITDLLSESWEGSVANGD